MGGWYCQKCQEYVAGGAVTFEETHDVEGCGAHVMWFEKGSLGAEVADLHAEIESLRQDAALGRAVLAMADKSREGCHDTSLSVSTTVDPVNDPLAEEWIVTNDFLCWGEGDTALMAFTDAGLMEAIGG